MLRMTGIVSSGPKNAPKTLSPADNLTDSSLPAAPDPAVGGSNTCAISTRSTLSLSTIE